MRITAFYIIALGIMLGIAALNAHFQNWNLATFSLIGMGAITVFWLTEPERLRDRKAIQEEHLQKEGSTTPDVSGNGDPTP